MEVKIFLEVGLNSLEVDNQKWADEFENYLIIHCKGADLVLRVNEYTTKLADSIWINIRKDFKENYDKVYTYKVEGQFYKTIIGDEKHLIKILRLIGSKERDVNFIRYFENVI